MANVNLVKSIYTSTVVTSLGELAAADTAEIPGNAQIDGLTASQAVLTDTNKKLVSLDYLNQAVKTTSSPTFAGATIGSLAGFLFGTAGAVSALAASARFHIGSLTRDMTAITGSVGYTGVGFTPGVVIFLAAVNDVASLYSVGFDNSLARGCLLGASATLPKMETSANAIYLYDGTNSQNANISSMDGDGFTLLWTKGGTPAANTATVYYLAIR
jgi:hypothetical protein